MASKLSQAQKVDVLFNKALGAVTDKDGAPFGALPTASAAAKIIPSLQIYADEIPAIAPIYSVDPLLSELVEDNTFAAKLKTNAQAGTAFAPRRYTGKLYPHIVKYENMPLFQTQDKTAYNGIVKKSPEDAENLLAQTIPFNYDPGKSYDITVKLQPTGSTSFINLPQENPTAPWFYDKDAGYLTFYGDLTTRTGFLGIPPLMTFWRYEGAFGLGSTGSGATGAQGPQGPQGIQGPPGTGGGGGSGDLANDTWLLNNLLGQPPALVFGKPVSKTTVVYVPWSYPSQIQAGWAANQWLPNITKFTGAVTTSNPGATGTYYPTTSLGSTSADWIKDPNNVNSRPATILAIQKTALTGGSPVIELTSDPTGPDGNTTRVYAYKYYDGGLSTALQSNTAILFTAYYSNPGNLGPFGITNSNSVALGGFSGAGPPGFVRSLAGPTNAIGVSMGASWVAPVYADTENPLDGGLISSYDISFNTTGSTIRYGGPISQAGNVNTTQTSISLVNLSPDSSYSIQARATNNSGVNGPYSTVPLIAYSGALAAPAALTTIAFNSTTTNSSNAYANQSEIRRVEGSSTLGSDLLLKGDKISIAPITVPLHRLANRGSDSSAPIMTITGILTTVEGPDVDYRGFTDSYVAPFGTSANQDVVITTTNNVTDYHTEPAKAGFYLKANNVAVEVVAAQATFTNIKQTLTVKQTFIESPTVTTTAISNPLYFYHENSLVGLPTCTIAIGDVSFTDMVKVSGLSVLTLASKIKLTGVTASNMGTYFYRTPLVNYYINSTRVKSETDLNNITAGKSTDNRSFATGNLTFDNSFNYTESTYQTTLVLGMEANSLNGLSTKSVTSNINVIADVRSYALVTSLSSSVATLTSGATVAGYRILSPATVTNLCPALPSNTTAPAQYNNATSLMDEGYQDELIVSDGYFASTQSRYMDYSSYQNPGINYSTIASPSSGYKFVSFFWKLGQSTPSYSSVSFIFDSISPNPTKETGTGLILMNNKRVKMFYAFRDTASDSYNVSKLNSGWIDANSTDGNGASMGTYWVAANNFGNYGGNTATSISGSSATVTAFIPSVNPVNDFTYLYLRIAVPTDTDIKFGKVSARLSL